MKIHKPIKCTIIKRYKRFLCDVRLHNGQIITVHVPNTGRMDTCIAEGWPGILSTAKNKSRKYAYTLEMTNNGQSFIGVNTTLTNHIVHEALMNKKLSELAHYDSIQAEVKIGESRLDFYLKNTQQECFLEVKNTTLVRAGIASFPDTVSLRGQKHLSELIQLQKQGRNTAMLYLVNRQDAKSFSSAKDRDPAYHILLKKAQSSGVMILAYQTKLTKDEIILDKKLELAL